MKNNPELIILTLICLLTVMMWIPYIARATRVNVAPAAGNGHSPSTGLAPWAQRAQRRTPTR